jgi:hypothetical protein
MRKCLDPKLHLLSLFPNFFFALLLKHRIES